MGYVRSYVILSHCKNIIKLSIDQIESISTFVAESTINASCISRGDRQDMLSVVIA